jgi:hypothetical protein
MKVIAQTPTITAGAYAAGDAIGGLLTFDIGDGSSIKTALLKYLTLVDNAASPVSADVDLHLFTDSTMAVADNAPLTFSTANVAAGKYLGKINFVAADYALVEMATSGAKACTYNTVDRLLPVTNGKIYGQLQANATPTYGSTTQLILVTHFADYA